jgi:hypothetical protein
MNDLTTKTSAECYDKSAKIFVSYDTKCYNQKLLLDTREEYECNSMQYTLQQEEEILHNQTGRKSEVCL